jgi:hypothetical protein
MISAEQITRTLEKFSVMTPQQADAMVKQMSKEQPTILAYLFASGEDEVFDEEGAETLLYLGIVVWQLMKQDPNGSRKVTKRELIKAEKKNISLLNKLASDSEGDFFSAAEATVLNCPEPEVLTFITEALIEDEESRQRYAANDAAYKENLGAAFLCLKIVLDAFIEIQKQKTVFTKGESIKKQTTREGARTIYQMRVSLKGSQPLIWRRFLVPADYTLEKLHRVLQVVMGWGNYHLHEFKVGGLSYGQPSPEFEDLMLNHKKATLEEVAPEPRSKFIYIYDFGDGWHHELKVEKIFVAQEGVYYPCCVGGERACPPEDCGGIEGFQELLEALENPATAEQRSLVEWAGDYDPNRFDIEAVNKQLRRMK